MRYGTTEVTRPAAHASRVSVVVETDDGSLGISAFDAFDEAGVDVTVCRGPSWPATGCPVLQGRRCPLIDGADVVVSRLSAPALLWAIRGMHPDVPVIAIGNEEPDLLPDGCAALATTCSVPGQVAAVQAAGQLHKTARRHAWSAAECGASPSEAERLARDIVEAWARHPASP